MIRTLCTALAALTLAAPAAALTVETLPTQLWFPQKDARTSTANACPDTSAPCPAPQGG